MFGANTKVLVVDDMETVRKAVAKKCDQIGLKNVTQASGGIDGWDKISHEKPPFELILCDWDMPQCSGLDLLIRLRRDSRLNETFFILLATELQMDQIEKAVKAKADDCILKNFTADALKEKLTLLYSGETPDAFKDFSEEE